MDRLFKMNGLKRDSRLEREPNPCGEKWWSGYSKGRVGGEENPAIEWANHPVAKRGGSAASKGQLEGSWTTQRGGSATLPLSSLLSPLCAGKFWAVHFKWTAQIKKQFNPDIL